MIHHCRSQFPRRQPKTPYPLPPTRLAPVVRSAKALGRRKRHVEPRAGSRGMHAWATWTTGANMRYGASNTAKPVEARNQAMQSALDAFERRMTLRLYAVSVGIVIAVALLRHLWT